MFTLLKTTSNLKKYLKLSIFPILIILVLWQIVFHSDYWSYALRNAFRDNLDITILKSAACRTYIPNDMNEEDFMRGWSDEIFNVHGFTYNDIKFTIESSCPVNMDIESVYSESYKKHADWMSTLDKHEYEIEKRLQEERFEDVIKTNNFKKKFLNNEFEVLQAHTSN